MLRAALLLLDLLAFAAHAQSPFSYTNRTGSGPAQAGDPIKLSEATAAGATKADATGGVLRSPTIRTGLGQMAFSLGEANAAVFGPGMDPLAGFHNGTVIVQKATSGEEHRGGGIDVALNVPLDIGCSNGGFYSNPVSRGVYGGRDIVAGCLNVAQPVPVASVVTAKFTNDPSNTNVQSTALAPNYPIGPTGQTAQGTKAMLSTALTPTQIGQLQPGMVVETNNLATGALTGWDPNGAWITVDTWVLIGSNPVLTGFNPASYGGTSLTINAVSQIYGANLNLTIPANGYRQNGHSANGLGIELAIDNEGQTVARSEFSEFNDSPRIWGANVGAGGGGGQGAGGFVTLGAWDKGFEVLSQTGYAGFLYGAGAGTPGEAAFVSQQNVGNAFEAKPQNRGGTRTFQVEATSGAITQGLAATRQAVHSVLWGPVTLSSSTPYPMTRDGNPSASAGNDPVVFVANGIYALDGLVACSDGTNGLQVHASGMWAAGANAASAASKSFQATTLSSFGTVAHWVLGASTDTIGWAPLLYFQGATGVSCSADVSVLQVH